MKRVITASLLTCILLLFLISQCFAATTYTLYINHRFGFGAQRPSSFTALGPPANGDGRAFISKDKNAYLVLSGSYNFYNKQDIKEEYMQSIADINFKGDLKYNKLGDTYYILSWIEGNHIYYEKVLFGKVQASLYFKYPIKQAQYYNAVISHIEPTFKLNIVKGYDFE